MNISPYSYATTGIDGDLSRTPLKLWRKYHKLMHLMG